MNKEALVSRIFDKKSYLCIGLDTDIRRIPDFLRKEKDPVFEFNRRIIDATADHCVAYKPNTAFYESLGARGWESLQRTMAYIPDSHFTIADAKRGDIGNTSGLYARAFFDKEASGMDFDAVTVAPYMGKDSVTPFLDFKDKWVVLLALTSNPGSRDFQRLPTDQGALYEAVIRTSLSWEGADRLMFVVGATQAADLSVIRSIAPDHFLLVPGVGAQGGSLKEVSENGLNSSAGLLVNASRSIIYAGEGNDFARMAAREAQAVCNEMAGYLEKYI